MKKQIWGVLLALAILLSLFPAAAFARSDYADTVVYGTIRTAEAEKSIEKTQQVVITK